MPARRSAKSLRLLRGRPTRAAADYRRFSFFEARGPEGAVESNLLQPIRQQNKVLHPSQSVPQKRVVVNRGQIEGSRDGQDHSRYCALAGVLYLLINFDAEGLFIFCIYIVANSVRALFFLTYSAASWCGQRLQGEQYCAAVWMARCCSSYLH